MIFSAGPDSSSDLALWVGIEPTVTRVGEEVLDQLVLSGFHERLSDVDLLGTLGAERVRFPLLWERTAPQGLKDADWRWADARLERLAEQGPEPILGLVHHGGGPRHTHLLDPAFTTGLAEYARAVAERYPHVRAYTPVNEPLTTARFSGLYGHWYPHAHDDGSFWRALMHQLRATVLSMQAIREVNPQAQLIQTEDMGRTFSTPALREQADFENERRWLSIDLLMGRVTPEHPLWGYLRSCGASEAELDWFCEHPCPPDILGLNTYVTSERFLDEHLDRYPAHFLGGNINRSYADVESVRVRGAQPGLGADRLREAHARYGLPLAITEAHLDCTREEQLRWLLESWRGAQQVRREGVDVRAVTAWAAFGAYEWNSLLTRREGHYENGLWDVRAPEPRPTALAGLARKLAAGKAAAPSHPVLAGPGWWHRRERLLYPPFGDVEAEPVAGPPLLITGETGTLGQAFRRACEDRGLPYVLCNRQQLDITDQDSIEAALKRWQPWAVINAAGYVRVDDAENDPRCERENLLGPKLLAEACAAHGLGLLTFSSDLVFGGDKSVPYLESDQPAPLNAYGRSKRDAEAAVLAALPGALVVRTSAFFGPWDQYNFAEFVRRELKAGRRVTVANDQTVSPTYVPDLTRVTLDLLIDGESGLWHLANVGATTWAGWARQVASLEGLDPELIDAVPTAQLDLPAARPHYSVLGSERAWLMPDFEDALQRWSMATRDR
ncbi:family 1 glycosylhydrolase [Deinococcus sp. Marseille-Q6407]|uniref:family 1 glycosylhydrolase n=1 Tax=Deinococcus sp. Marseille-Q6407 TaxID=2969223 RepID=UPI0021C0E847|nr:family 1 glycosylhydrolase [Deinococcus sp. Marseille-Q6407]